MATTEPFIEPARHQGMLETLHKSVQDPDIIAIKAYSKFVVAYLLQQDGPSPGWRKANIEGPVYLVERRKGPGPRYQLLVLNQFSNNNLLDGLHPSWELDCQKNYVFFKVEDTSKRIRGLWFHDDAERQKMETSLEYYLKELREGGNDAPAGPPGSGFNAQELANVMSAAVGPEQAAKYIGQAPGLSMTGMAGGMAGAGGVQVTRSQLRAAMHALADDDAFITFVMNKLKSSMA